MRRRNGLSYTIDCYRQAIELTLKNRKCLVFTYTVKNTGQYHSISTLQLYQRSSDSVEESKRQCVQREKVFVLTHWKIEILGSKKNHHSLWVAWFSYDRKQRTLSFIFVTNIDSLLMEEIKIVFEEFNWHQTSPGADKSLSAVLLTSLTCVASACASLAISRTDTLGVSNSW